MQLIGKNHFVHMDTMSTKCTHGHYEENVHMDILLNVVVENLQRSLV